MLAFIDKAIWIFEVTTSENDSELEKKIRQCQDLMIITEAQRAVIVAPKKPEGYEEASLDEVYFVTFEELYSKPQKFVLKYNR